MKQIQTICVVGGGSAGSLAALTLKRLLPGRKVISVTAPDVPVIGVGESTTAYLPLFLHRQLALDPGRFHREVKPSWKLGIRFNWGPPETDHFNYPFSLELSERVGNLRKRAAYYHRELGGAAGMLSSLMDADLSPIIKSGGQYQIINLPYGYHIDNKRFLAYLETIGAECGVEQVSGHVVEVRRGADGDVTALGLRDGREIAADLFVDCTGFRSLLLHEAMGERYQSYAPVLRCDTAVIAEVPRKGLIRPYTTAETMENGWCWRIELPDRVTVGYVHSSDFCSQDAAADELRRRNPDLDNLRCVRFPSGRTGNFWRGNVVGIGNASGFVEPLEATALHLICEQLLMVTGALLDADYRIAPDVVDSVNARFRQSWDAVRDFLAVHYKFNTRSDSAFWRACRADTDLGGAEELVRLYQELGPHSAVKHATPPDTLVQFEGYLALLIGQGVPVRTQSVFDAQDRKDWADLQAQYRAYRAKAVPLREALGVVEKPDWRWP